MYLKSYMGISDRKLIEVFNGSIYFQLFCGIRLNPGQQIINYKIVSQIRCELAQLLEIKEVQAVLAKYWAPYMRNKSKIIIDATCYESHVRYPTHLKLLWESTSCLYEAIAQICSSLRIRLPRTKYEKWKLRYSIHSRKKRKPKKEKIALTRAFLKLIPKLDKILDQFEHQYGIKLTQAYQQKRETIQKVHAQQLLIFTTGLSPKNKIVSLAKPYLHPIVRGKETKKVEFGAKVNKLQIDGISFIQHLSFKAFNECTQFQKSICQAQRLTGTPVKQAGADAIYATNANRKFATIRGIKTDFVRKGRAGKNEVNRKEIAKKLRKERASFLEGSFGNEKEHYNLKRINARTKKTEILWIFFGIHTANALKIGHRIATARCKATRIAA